MFVKNVLQHFVATIVYIYVQIGPSMRSRIPYQHPESAVCCKTHDINSYEAGKFGKVEETNNIISTFDMSKTKEKKTFV